jgi:hypothetical protein
MNDSKMSWKTIECIGDSRASSCQCSAVAKGNVRVNDNDRFDPALLSVIGKERDEVESKMYGKAYLQPLPLCRELSSGGFVQREGLNHEPCLRILRRG